MKYVTDTITQPSSNSNSKLNINKIYSILLLFYHILSYLILLLI
jgi:hypothetical protein